jgi:hypothetical protein
MCEEGRSCTFVRFEFMENNRMKLKDCNELERNGYTMCYPFPWIIGLVGVFQIQDYSDLSI